jgi:DNA invertase Pin-like site-specific DNA recombinase
MSVFAELERKLIGQRIKEAMAVVKLRGTKSGKPIGKPRKYPPAVCQRIRELHANGVSLRNIGKEYKMAHQTVDRIVKRGALT